MRDVKLALNGVKNVVIDLDGTMYDKRSLARRLVLRLFPYLPLIVIDRAARGACWRWLVSTRWYSRVYMPTMVSLIGRHCPVREETMELIRTCREQQIPMAVYSDYSAIDAKLRVLGIEPEWFSLLIDSPSLGERKPSYRAAMAVLEKMHADPATTLFVGDRDDTDGESARLVGARFLHIQ